MVKDLLLDASPRHVATFSLAYSQARPWPRIRLAVARALFIFLAAWLLAATVAQITPLSPGRTQLQAQYVKHVLVIDSGSSGTRVYAYNWTLPAPAKPGLLPIVHAIPPNAAAHLIPRKRKAGLYDRVETQPGLDAFAGNPSGLSADALGPLLAWARAVVPAQQHAITPLFLMGTGGLRRMEPQGVHDLLQEIRKILGQSGFRFEPSWAKVISGTQEGIYGWLALNYQQGLLHQQQPAEAAVASAHGTSILGRRGQDHAPQQHSISLYNTSDSLGSLDLGGSSLEITFEVDIDQHPSPFHDFRNVTLADRIFHLHTHTFQHYGLNEAFDRAVTLLYKQQQEDSARTADKMHQVSQASAAANSALSRPALHEPPAVATETSGPVAGVVRSPNSSTGRSDIGDLAEQQLQADLAAAAAAGLQLPPAVGAESPRGSAMVNQSVAAAVTNQSVLNTTPDTALLVEQHRQADLAVAAAAGLHPRPSASTLATQQMQVDAAVAAVAGVRSAPDAAVQQKPAPVPDVAATSDSIGSIMGDAGVGVSTRISASVSSEQESSSHGMPGSIMEQDHSVVIMPGIHQAKQHTSKPDTSSDRVIAGDQPPQTSQKAATPGLADAGLHRKGRALLQRHSRQQRRQQRQLLLRQHVSELQSWERGYSSLAEELLEELQELATQQQQPIGTSSLAEIQLRSGSLQQPQQRVQSSMVGLTGWRQLQARDLPVGGSNSGVHHMQQGGSVPAAAAPIAVAPSSTAATGISQGQLNDVDPAESSAAGDASTPPAVPGDASRLSVVLHPCMHDGYEAPYERTTYTGHKPQPAKVLLKGSPNWSSCLKLIDQVVDATKPCNATAQRPACRLGAAQPQLQGNFLALTGFYVVRRFLSLSSEASLDAVLGASQELCSRPWSWIQQHMGQQINAERYCTWGPYTVKLLRDGLQLRDSAVHVGGGDLGWPLGAALSEASKLPDMMEHWVAVKVATGGAAVAAAENKSQESGEQRAGAAEPAEDLSQRSSLAQRLWGSRRRMHMGHVAAVFMCVVAWLSVVVYCLPPRQHASVGVGPWSTPVQSKKPGRASQCFVLPMVAHPWGRNSPTTTRSSSIRR